MHLLHVALFVIRKIRCAWMSQDRGTTSMQALVLLVSSKTNQAIRVTLGNTPGVSGIPWCRHDSFFFWDCPHAKNFELSFIMRSYDVVHGAGHPSTLLTYLYLLFPLSHILSLACSFYPSFISLGKSQVNTRYYSAHPLSILVAGARSRYTEVQILHCLW